LLLKAAAAVVVELLAEVEAATTSSPDSPSEPCTRRLGISLTNSHHRPSAWSTFAMEKLVEFI
jgi:hypothetical protein